MNKDKLVEWLEGEVNTFELVEAQHNNLVSHYLGNIKKLVELLKEAE